MSPKEPHEEQVEPVGLPTCVDGLDVQEESPPSAIPPECLKTAKPHGCHWSLKK